MLKKPGELRSRELLYVVVPLSNPVRYHSRYRLFHQFVERMISHPNVHLVLVEAAYGDRVHDARRYADDPRCTYVPLRIKDELWHKENLINIGVSRLPEDWQYVAWIDADVEFNHRHWATETLHQLQHHQIVQLFTNALDTDPNGNVLQVHHSLGYLYQTGQLRGVTHQEMAYYDQKSSPYGGPPGIYPHPGFAWAARREAIDHMGGLIDWAIIGAGDHHMALAWIGRAEKSMPPGISEPYKKKIMAYQDHCRRFIRQDVGYIDGTLVHHWHGKKVQRFYWDRWKILTETKFDPDLHIKKDFQGLWQLDPDQVELRDLLRRYFRCRLEDSIDLE